MVPLKIERSNVADPADEGDQAVGAQEEDVVTAEGTQH